MKNRYIFLNSIVLFLLLKQLPFQFSCCKKRVLHHIQAFMVSEFIQLRPSINFLWRPPYLNTKLRKILTAQTVPLTSLNWNQTKTNSVALSPHVNYTNWAAATCWRNLVPAFVDRGVPCGQRGGSPMVVNLFSRLEPLIFLSSSSSFTVKKRKVICAHLSDGGCAMNFQCP
jgi:hypothetical protein